MMIVPLPLYVVSRITALSLSLCSTEDLGEDTGSVEIQ